jgi:acetyl esterase
MYPIDIDAGVRDYLSRVTAATLAGPFPDEAARRRAQMEHVALTVSPARSPAIAARDWFLPMQGREVPLRIYRPPGAGPKPLILFFHGGGFVAGSLETHDYLASAFCEGTGSVVVSVHYRRAPENRHPAQLDDCYAALAWAAGEAEFLGIDPNRIAVAGDSAGAHLATSCAIRARDRGGPPLRFQLLIYPMIEPVFDTPSYLALAEAPGLTREDAMFYWWCFLGDLGAPPPAEAVPSASDLAGLPATFVVTAEHDPLRDEGEAYADRLRAAGVPVDVHRAERLIHGFMRAAPFSAAVRSVAERTCRELTDALVHRSAPANATG